MYDTIFKVVFFGEDGVGTSSLLKLTTSDFIYDTKLTIGVDLWVKKKTKDVDLREKVLQIDGRTVKLLILRLSNEERFRDVVPRYLKAAHGAIFMYDITNPVTLERIPEWTSMVRTHVGKIPILLVGGKADLVNKREVSREEALEIKKSGRLDAFIECDSKSGENVEEVFETLSRLMIQRSGFHSL
ncbi:MAG: GTP-binding protein [Promethearchaeota archaeon]